MREIKVIRAIATPTNWAKTNQSAESGEIAEGASEKILPTVTAGLANEVDEVKMWPANIHAATDAATSCVLSNLTRSRIKSTSPQVATISPRKVAVENRAISLTSIHEEPNIKFAMTAPDVAPAI